MKKVLLLLPYAFTLCACATLGGVGTVGSNFDDYILRYGVPTSQYTLQNGDTAYSFIKQCPYAQAQEEKVVVVGPDNTISSVSYVTHCPSVPNEEPRDSYQAPQPPRAQEHPKENREPAPAVTQAPAKVETDPNSAAGKLLAKLDEYDKKNQEKLNTLQKELKEREAKESSMNGEISRLRSEIALLKAMDQRYGSTYANPSPSISTKEGKIAQIEKELKAYQTETSKIKGQIRALEIMLL